MAKIAQKLRNIYFPYRIFTALCFSFLLGILVTSFLSINFCASWLIFLYTIPALILIGLFNYIFRMRSLALISFCFLSFFLAISYYSFIEWKNQREIPFGQDIELTGKITQRTEIGPKYQKIILQIENSSLADNENGLKNAKIIVRAPVYPEYRFAEILAVKGKVTQPENFSGFDYKSYLKRWHIVGEMQYPEKVSYVNRSTKLSDRSYGILLNVADRFEYSLNRILPEPHASLASGILLGIKRNIPDDFALNLQKTGLTHIIALSGFNVTILIAVFADTLVFYLGRRKTFILGMIFVLLFVLMTGAAASVVRAAIFSFFILFGRTIGRRADQTNLILLTAVAMVLANPYVLPYDVGFQLSFLAFIGLIYLSPVIQKFFTKRHFNWLPNWTKMPLAETMSAQITVAPLILVKFGLISLISPLANLLVVWTIPWIMLTTFVAGTLGLIYIPLGKMILIVLWPALEYVIRVVNMLANLPLSSLKF